MAGPLMSAGNNISRIPPITATSVSGPNLEALWTSVQSSCSSRNLNETSLSAVPDGCFCPHNETSVIQLLRIVAPLRSLQKVTRSDEVTSDLERM